MKCCWLTRFCTVWSGAGTVLHPLWLWILFLQSVWVSLSSAVHGVCTYLSWWPPFWRLKGDPLQILGVLSLCTSLLSGPLLCKIQITCSPQTSISCPQLKGWAGLCLGSPPCTVAGKLSQDSKRAATGLAFLVSCCLEAIVLPLSHVQYLENCFRYIFFLIS